MSAKKEQGFINQYRKPFLLINILVFVGIWFFVSPLFQIPWGVKDIFVGIGSIFLFIGVVGRVFSSLTIASHKNETVIQTEMYSIVRHPLYFFSSFIASGLGFLTERPELLLLSLFIFFSCFYPMMINEESYLTNKFGKSYLDYMKNVPRFIPRLSNWKTARYIQIDLKLVIKTLLDGFIALLIIPLITIVHYLASLI
ncbi:MAG: isoprenylcysteine carboxylmethyltransferase family protein [Alphaproteobacteria bacterium]|nr:isoprenylcysteine carboxylmethyltransferase family protein [Alphaproteobacteria bacterium]